MDAILYCSNAGHTKAYAEMLAEKTGLKAYELGKEKLTKQSSVIFMGWVMGDMISGLKKARRAYDVKVVCPVGMCAPSASRDENLREKNELPKEMALFSLPGGLEFSKLNGVYKLMMGVVKNEMVKKLNSKSDISENDKLMLDKLENERNEVDVKHLEPLLSYLATLN